MANSSATTPEYVPGQRWISNAEAELGLGVVEDNAGRRVTLSFPAVGEMRTYAINNAPLSRVQYSVGERISSNDGLIFIITDRIEQNGCFVYRGVDGNGQTINLEEIDLDSAVRFSKPQDRLFAGQIDKSNHFQLRVETLSHRHRHQQSPAYGLLGARVQLLPHQLYIASQVAQRYAPRVLLADEVGLGKTIEAGLILHQQLINGRTNRALVVVPENLIHQWLVEMWRRFNLRFTILDEERCDELEGSGIGNPFESAQLVLCSLAFLVDNPLRHNQAQLAQWDLLIVDEAHHLEWSEQQASPAYQCIEALSREVSGLLLLTATPEQLGVESHFARLRLLDPDRYHDLQEFRAEEDGYRAVSDLVQQLLAEDAVQQLSTASLQEKIQHYLGATAVEELKAVLQNEDEDEDAIDTAVEALINNLLDRHGTGRVLFRNTRDAVEGFPERQLHQYSLTPPANYSELARAADLQQRLYPETLLGESWLKTDARVDWLVQWLNDHRNEKTLLICARAETAQALEEYLRLRVGVLSAVFHEGLTLLARDRAAAYFADEQENAQILLCSEIGSEGRNFQFAQHLILFDLPLNPDLLEQRIGRLDRIGQRHDVQIHVPYYQDSTQAVLLRWYHEGVNAFERVCPAAQNIFQYFNEPLQQCLINSGDQDALDTLLAQTQALTEQTLQTLQQGRDRLLELNSYNPKQAAEIVENITEATRSLELVDYMERVFDYFGVDQQTHSTHSVVLHPGDHMICDSFPGLPEDGITVTYQRANALVQEGMQFLTWEHPMVGGAMEMIGDGEFGNSAMCTIKGSPLKPGTLLLEAIFTVHCPAPRSLQLQRYIPQSSLRVVVDANGNDLSEKLTEKYINNLAEKVRTRTAQELVRHTRMQLSELIERAELRVETQQTEIVEQAIQQMQQQQEAELQRLTALAEVNPNIRAEEIEHLRVNAQQLQEYLSGAKLQLDALRVVVAT